MAEPTNISVASSSSREDLAARLRDKRLADRFVFHNPVSDAEIEAAEIRLGVRFPDDYRWFLREIGP
ncbi:MAG TPA: SMI1/KNR4 family protein, partial [Armatimonadota bacterium]|nr:SMI1/KNR4 family protein [Armatimonadota bacterium]